MNRKFLAFAIALPLVFASVSFAMTAEEENDAWKKEPAYGRAINVGYNGELCLSTFGIAHIKGFYADEGIKTVITRTGSTGSSTLADAMGVGKIDIAGDHIATALIPTINGVKIKFITTVHTGCKSLCVLADGPIKSTKDLVGKTIAIPNGIGASDQNITMRLLKRDGLDPLKDVKYKVVESGAAVMALQSGEIQAVLLSDQFVQQFLDNGTLRVIRSITHDEDFKVEPCCVHIAGLDFCEQNPITVKKLARAHERARKWIMANRSEAVKVLQENGWASGDPDLVKRIYLTLDFSVSDETTGETLRKVIDDYREFGLIQSDASTDDLLKRVWDPVLLRN